MPHILFVTHTRIGDAVLSTGVLDYARTLVPGAEVTIACGVTAAPLFRAEPDLKALHVLKKQRGDGHWFALLRTLRAERYDLTIDLRGSLVTYALNARKRIVYRRTSAVRHKVEEFTALMRAPRTLDPRLHLDDAARMDAQGALAGTGPLLVIGAGAGLIAKTWRADRFAAVARRLTSPSGALAGAAIAVLGGPEDGNIVREIVSSLDADGIAASNLAGSLDLPACAALIQRATLFIGNDSGLMHIAAAAGAATLGLFGPSDERRYGPWGQRTRALRGRPYADLMAYGDPHASAVSLMDDLSVDAVEQAASELVRAGGLEMSFDLLIRGGRVFTPGGLVDADIGVRGGKIAAIGALGQSAHGASFDAKGLTLLPGVIDTQVHFREPGLVHKEDLETGSRAAALGGVTAVFEMPNTTPPTSTPEALNEKLRLAKGRMHVDHAFYAGATEENADHLAELERLPGCAGIKTFMGSSTGALLVRDDAGLNRVLKSITRRAAFHAEDEDRLTARKALARDGDWTSHPEVRDDETALKAVQRLVTAARAHGKRVHVLHVSSKREMEYLAGAKDVATVETLPQFLTFEGPDVYTRLKGFAQMNPPIRYADDRAALWDLGIAQGVVDVLGTDHAPHTREEKAQAYPKSPSGMPGVQTLVPVMLTHVAQGRLSLQRFVDLTSAGPQRVFGIAGKGRIALGYDADFTLVDLKAQRTIADADQATRVGWTPFDGFTATGWPIATIVRGLIVMRDGAIATPGAGAPIRFLEALR